MASHPWNYPLMALTIPPKLIHWLQVKPGEPIHLAMSPDGNVDLEPAPKAAKIDVRTLSGCLYNPDRKPVSLAGMEPAIVEGAAVE